MSVKNVQSVSLYKYQDWCANEVLKQLTRGVEPCDVNVDVRLKNIKPLHANWPIQTYPYLKTLFFGIQESSHN